MITVLADFICLAQATEDWPTYRRTRFQIPFPKTPQHCRERVTHLIELTRGLYANGPLPAIILFFDIASLNPSKNRKVGQSVYRPRFVGRYISGWVADESSL